MELEKLRHGTELIKRGFAKMQKGGVIMDVVNADQAKIAEEAGCCCSYGTSGCSCRHQERGWSCKDGRSTDSSRHN